MIADLDTITAELDSQLPQHRKGLAIVRYHVQLPPGSIMDKWRGGEPCDYAPVIKRSDAAIAKVHPEAQSFFLTSHDDKIETDAKLIKLSVGPHLGLNRTLAWLAWAKLWEGPTLYIDTDIRLHRSFWPVLNDTGYDYSWSWRLPINSFYSRMPINGGLLVQREAKPTAAFLETMAEQIIMLANLNHRTDWLTAGGEQMALANMCHGLQPGYHDQPWGRLGLFFADTFEHVPGINHTADGKDYADDEGPFAIHDKGKRKTRFTSPTPQ